MIKNGVDIEYVGVCQGCRESDLYLLRTDIPSLGETYWNIRCGKEASCQYMERIRIGMEAARQIRIVERWEEEEKKDDK